MASVQQPAVVQPHHGSAMPAALTQQQANELLMVRQTAQIAVACVVGLLTCQ